jgi:hypothetical protein
MAIIENPPSSLVPQLQGVHMFGFDGAPCSQRVSFGWLRKACYAAKKYHTCRPPPRTFKPATAPIRFVRCH